MACSCNAVLAFQGVRVNTMYRTVSVEKWTFLHTRLRTSLVIRAPYLSLQNVQSLNDSLALLTSLILSFSKWYTRPHITTRLPHMISNSATPVAKSPFQIRTTMVCIQIFRCGSRGTSGEGARDIASKTIDFTNLNNSN